VNVAIYFRDCRLYWGGGVAVATKPVSGNGGGGHVAAAAVAAADGAT